MHSFVYGLQGVIMFWNFSKFFPNEPAFSVASLKCYVMQRDDHFFKILVKLSVKQGISFLPLHVYCLFNCPSVAKDHSTSLTEVKHI